MRVLGSVLGMAATASAASVSQLDADGVATLLQSWDLDHAFSDCFRSMKVTGEMLQHDFNAASDVDLSLCPNAMPAHANKLIRKLSALKQSSGKGAARGRRLADMGADFSGLQIKSDTASIKMGADDDVSISRDGPGSLGIAADVNIDGTLNVADEDFVSTVSDWHVFVGEQPITLKRNVPVSQSFSTAAEYELQLDIKPTGTHGNWGSIIHFTETGDNCCDYGSRIPALWMYADSSRLLVVAGSNSTGNANAGPEEELPLNSWTTVRIRAEGDTADIYYNDTWMGEVETDQRMPHDDVTVWMSDNWHDPAYVDLRNVKYRRIAWHHSNFYNEYTEHDIEESLESRVEELEAQLEMVTKSTYCSRAECCNSNYEWSGDTLTCWASWYDSFDEDPCGCTAVVQDLGSATAFDHEKNCIEQGAHLMSVHSGTAGDAVAEYGSTFWLGLYDRKNEGVWHWFDGTELNYDSWNTNEPNDSNGEDCVHTTGSNTVWNDQDCEESLSYYGLCLWQ